MKCRHCGCTDERACPGGCFWIFSDPPLCSRCAIDNLAGTAVTMNDDQRRMLAGQLVGLASRICPEAFEDPDGDGVIIASEIDEFDEFEGGL